MASFNKIIIVGYLGRDPEVKESPNGNFCVFPVATTEKRKDEEKTTWFRVTAFGRQAEVCTVYLQKGSQVYCEGRLSQREYTDREGVARQSLEVTVTEIKFLGSAPPAEAETPAPARQPAPVQRQAAPAQESRPQTPAQRPARQAPQQAAFTAQAPYPNPNAYDDDISF